jgi:hypothetical protein
VLAVRRAAKAARPAASRKPERATRQEGRTQPRQPESAFFFAVLAISLIICNGQGPGSDAPADQPEQAEPQGGQTQRRRKTKGTRLRQASAGWSAVLGSMHSTASTAHPQ